MPKDRGDIQGHTQDGEAGREKGRRTRERAVGGRPDLTEQSAGKREKQRLRSRAQPCDLLPLDAIF